MEGGMLEGVCVWRRVGGVKVANNDTRISTETRRWRHFKGGGGRGGKQILGRAGKIKTKGFVRG